MININEEENLKDEIEEAKLEIWQKDNKVEIFRIKVEDERPNGNTKTYVGWFAKPNRIKLKNIQKKYKEVMDFAEALANDTVIYPKKKEYDEFAKYNYGLVIDAGLVLYKSLGFNSNSNLEIETYEK